MQKIIFKITILLFFFLFITSTLSSCEKVKDTIGVIIVKDSNGSTVSGATVVLHQDGAVSQQGSAANSEIRKTNITDANGRAEFTYELEAILQVDVEKVEGNNVYTGTNIIRLLKEKTVTQVVEVN